MFHGRNFSLVKWKVPEVVLGAEQYECICRHRTVRLKMIVFYRNFKKNCKYNNNNNKIGICRPPVLGWGRFPPHHVAASFPARQPYYSLEPAVLMCIMASLEQETSEGAQCDEDKHKESHLGGQSSLLSRFLQSSVWLILPAGVPWHSSACEIHNRPS